MPASSTRTQASLLHILLFAFLISLSGCASTHPPAPITTPAPDEFLPAQAALLAPSDRSFNSVAGSTPSILRVRIEPDLSPVSSDHYRAMWTVTRQSHPHNTEPHDKLTSHRVQTWLELPDGSIALSREVNHDESVIVDFDPPMVIFPARIARSDASTDAPPGFTQQTFVTVHPMNKPEKVRVKGPATQRIWYDGFESPPASSTMLHPAARLRATCEIDFGVSRSTNHTITHLHPTLGVLHELRRELAVAFTVTVRDTTEEWSATTPDFTIK